MENIPFNLLDLIYSPKLILLTIVIIYLGQLVEQFIARGEREKSAAFQRELYFRKLTEESLKMEANKLKEEMKHAESIENLQHENDEIKSQLDDLDSDWSAEESASNDGEIEDSSGTIEHLKREVVALEEKEKVMQSVEDDISRMTEDLAAANMDLNVADDEDILEARLKQLEAENNELKVQLAAHQSLALGRHETNLDPELLDYLENHDKELSLAFLEKTYETLLELKASHPEKDFGELIEELKRGQSYATELAALRIAKKEAEIKLQAAKRRYEEELSSFDESRVEHILKSVGGKEYMEKLKEKNRVNNDIIINLKMELESKKNDLYIWQNKYREAEKQCNVYWQSWKESLQLKERLEAEKKAQKERAAFNQSMNMSSASSLIDNQVPPPPPIVVPPISELLRLADQQEFPNQQQQQQYNSPGINPSIPSPPPLDIQYR